MPVAVPVPEYEIIDVFFKGTTAVSLKEMAKGLGLPIGGNKRVLFDQILNSGSEFVDMADGNSLSFGMQNSQRTLWQNGSFSPHRRWHLLMA